MKKILYLSFYFEPDLCAGSFRNTPLVEELSKQATGRASIDVFTTLPNRYASFEVEAARFEERGNYCITRIAIPTHKSGMKDQILSFKKYYSEVRRLVRNKHYDLVVASSSRLFTAFLGYKLAKRHKIPLYLDIRDIFYDTLQDVLPTGIVKRIVMPLIKRVEKKTFNYASHINLISEGFKPYFEGLSANFSYFPNGIDEIFMHANRVEMTTKRMKSENLKNIVYAGNIGEGQGLHKIIPQAAKELEGRFKFTVIGDGGAKQKLIEGLTDLKVNNVELRSPMNRDELIDVYSGSDFLFVHLNDFKAFEKVLPSKLFELATFPLPIIAGVRGFAAKFADENIDNLILFEPCNVRDFVEKLSLYRYRRLARETFVNKFTRKKMNQQMASTILAYID